MIAGMDRYFQICRCFRDEDLRADRQPEFTQIDVEMSFATPDLVYGAVEGAIQAMWKVAGHDVPVPFARMSYRDALLKYGSDKPDLRPGMEISDLGAALAGSPADFVQGLDGEKQVARGFVVRGGGRYSDSERKELVEVAGRLFNGRLSWAREGRRQGKRVRGPLATSLCARRSARRRPAGRSAPVHDWRGDRRLPTMGALRLHVAKKENLLKQRTSGSCG